LNCESENYFAHENWFDCHQARAKDNRKSSCRKNWNGELTKRFQIHFMRGVFRKKIETKKSLLPLPGFVERKPETLSPKSVLVHRGRVVCVGIGGAVFPCVQPPLNREKSCFGGFQSFDPPW
jgi:hypothetical protein